MKIQKLTTLFFLLSIYTALAFSSDKTPFQQGDSQLFDVPLDGQNAEKKIYDKSGNSCCACCLPICAWLHSLCKRKTERLPLITK